MLLGERIRDIIHKRRIGLPKVSQETGITHATLHRILKSDEINSKFLVKLSEFLEVPVSAFFEEESISESSTISTSVKKPIIKASAEAPKEENSLVVLMKEQISLLKSSLEKSEKYNEDIRNDKEELQKDKQLLWRILQKKMNWSDEEDERQLIGLVGGMGKAERANDVSNEDKNEEQSTTIIRKLIPKVAETKKTVEFGT